MSAFDVANTAAQQDPFILTPVQYNDLCIAIAALPDDEQPQWDDTVLNFTYSGKLFDIPSAPVATQGDRA